jgi:hypothetical protein
MQRKPVFDIWRALGRVQLNLMNIYPKPLSTIRRHWVVLSSQNEKAISPMGLSLFIVLL